MSYLRTMDDLNDIRGRRCLLRVDWNVPFIEGKIADVTRIERSVPTILELVRKKAKIVILSHLGRPNNKSDKDSSLCQVIPIAESILKKKILFVEDCIGFSLSQSVSSLSEGGIILTENVRFYPGEENNDPDFVNMLAENGDFYINDAFSVSHRVHASIEGLSRLLPSYMGRAMQKELSMLEVCFSVSKKPLVAIIGGSKVSTKIDFLGNLVKKVDKLVIGGGMANSFLVADGMGVGRSLCQRNFSESVRQIVFEAQKSSCEIILPQDVVVAKEMKKGIATQSVSTRSVPSDSMILDIGFKTIEYIKQVISQAKTVIWNGPLGVFEIEPFDLATVEIARYVAKLTKEKKIISIAGGGDTITALSHAGIVDEFTYVSTAGGAFFEWLKGTDLPGLAALSSSDGSLLLREKDFVVCKNQVSVEL
ncbi:phosphoglycerate kinase [Candidatus Liberibacter solanacearum]|uniref:Phosphoglycerate kinase n=1 Tax=Candidatus Liberibacter solanacearum TaxID=556287 RepID=A0A1V2N7R7_9HYPH|nr:phosphoglycerate kinase [Candidatus Liberibacter solanacearum]ONI59259.1 phosphoglycerate kinase [Candidatus Liberibacter solanacearum]ONI59618.1 phosphoglycerate kinase [Candidatus Liberibacter solanacearum]